jgi:uncharacterized membrane protein YqhA
MLKRRLTNAGTYYFGKLNMTPTHTSMLEKLLRLRFIFMIAVIVTFLNSMFFLYLGVRNAFHGYHDVIMGAEKGTPGLAFLESLDMFMVGLVFLIFSLGMMRIFTHYHVADDKLPGWLRIHSFKELKILLWETVLVTLVIVSVSTLVRNITALTWHILIIPAMILVLSISLYVMRKEENHH